MGYVKFTLSTALIAILLRLIWHKTLRVAEVPNIPLGYWGPGPQQPDDRAIRPFTINISNADEADFVARLDNTRESAEPLEGVGFQYGFNARYLRKLVQFWKREYKWKERESYLNRFPQFKTQIAGLGVHFIHVKPNVSNHKGKNGVPVLLLHGWPGSVREFYDMISILQANSPSTDVVYEVIAPSLPGYGWSDPPRRPGMGPAQMATVFKELMIRLGHRFFVVHGGDWGSAVGSAMAILHPSNVVAFHSNMCLNFGKSGVIPNLLAYLFPRWFVEERMAQRFPAQWSNVLEETGHFHLHATKPDTIGVALTDSPAGLAAYILEKFSTLTNNAWKNLPDGGLENWDKTAILDNVMIYWFSKSITTSMRLYAEAYTATNLKYDLDSLPITVPTACARFDQEFIYPPAFTLRSRYVNLAQLTDYAQGGHFAAMERPQIMVDDLKKFIDIVIT